MTSDSVRRDNVTRDFRHGTRGESAARCIGPISKGCDIFGLTKGDFGKIDILRHIVREIGPCRVDIGTWTAEKADISKAHGLFDDNKILSMRWLVDRSFLGRRPEFYRLIHQHFGDQSIRTANFHAKFILLDNEEYSVAVRTSMNLNMNKRIESYEISEGSPISDYLRGVVDYHFDHAQCTDSETFRDFAIEDQARRAEAQPRLGRWD